MKSTCQGVFCRRPSAVQLICVILPILVASCCEPGHAQTHVITATGTLDTVAATDASGADSTASLLSILPFSAGATVTSRTSFETFTFDNTVRIIDQAPESGFSDVIEFSTLFQTDSFNAPGFDLDFFGAITGPGTEVTFRDDSALLLASNSLDLPEFTESELSSSDFEISFLSGGGPIVPTNTLTTPLGTHVGGSVDLTGQFTSVTAEAVPEPTGGTFLLLSGVAIFLKRKRTLNL